MTLQGKGKMQGAVLDVLATSGGTLSGPEIYDLLADLTSVEQTKSFQAQIRRALEGLCNPNRRGDPGKVVKSRHGTTNYFTLTSRRVTQDMISAIDRELATRFRDDASAAVLTDPKQVAQIGRDFRVAVAIQTWKRVKCAAGEEIDATEKPEAMQAYLSFKTGMCSSDLQKYIYEEAERIRDGRPWVPLELIR